MATFGNRNVGYTPFFAQGMQSVGDAITTKRDRQRKEAKTAEANELAQMAYMGDPQALQDLAMVDPEMAMKVEDQAVERKKGERQTETEKDTAFQADTKRIMQQISQFDTFEEAQAFGDQQTAYLTDKYPQRSQQQGAGEFTPETFAQIKKIMQGSNQGKPVGVPFRATNAAGDPVMAQQTALPNGGTVTRYLKDPEGNLITPAEYDSGLARTVAGAKAGGAIEGGAAATIETTADVAAATAEGAAAATAIVELPALVEQSRATINSINGLRNDPALGRVTGAMWLNPEKLIPGTPAYDFMERSKQVAGKVFAQAYETLKGGGPITEIESEEAKKAIARMSTAQSKEAYLEALDDFESSIRRAVAAKEKESSGDFSYEPLPARTALSSEYTRNNPATVKTPADANKLPAGSYFMAEDGVLRRTKGGE